ncbi:putative RecB family nuclease [Saccharopolyspora gloriosae]|uniref:Putative RecB family nuclease n=1 Tax=Saccharopolyspora gloriosae TaxID=455344 RepID=A0A840NWN2_9PSEU|nr:putative RecB family nuclease [Saccharopolyspora gloriosae]
MENEVLLDAGVVTRCRRRVHLENDPQSRDLPKAPMDPGIEQRVADAADHRRAIADRLGELLGESWARIPREASLRRRERETLEAMRDGVRFISGAQLPANPEAGRFGGIDLLVRNGSGYTPVLVVRHKTTDPGSGARTSPLESPLPESAKRNGRRKVRAQPRDQLRLAHLVRLLEACGMAAPGTPVGGVIGVEGDLVVWHDLLAPNWPGGRTALAEYDARFADRVAVATAAATGAEPLAQPSRVTECKGCPWWPTCSAELRDARDVSLVVRGEDAAVLRAAQVRTVDDLAAMTPEQGRATSLGAARADEAVLLAKAWLRDLPLVRRVRELRVPRADVEIDVDMESYADSGAYMWGCWLSGADVDEEQGYRAFVTWDPLPSDDEARSFAEFWCWFVAVRERAHARGLTFRAYCYNELAENRWMLSSAERFAGKPGIPEVSEVRRFIGSDEWVDLFAAVRDQFLCPHGKGLKVIAPSAGFAWRDPEASGENSMRWYRDAVGLDGQEQEPSQRSRLLQYNEDDVRATWTIRRWMTSPEARSIPFTEDL